VWKDQERLNLANLRIVPKSQIRYQTQKSKGNLEKGFEEKPAKTQNHFGLLTR